MRSATQEIKDLDSVGWRDYNKMNKKNCNVAKAKVWKAIRAWPVDPSYRWVSMSGEFNRPCDMPAQHLFNAYKLTRELSALKQSERRYITRQYTHKENHDSLINLFNELMNRWNVLPEVYKDELRKWHSRLKGRK